VPSVHGIHEHPGRARLDTRVNPLGAKGIGERGIVGTAAAVANAVHHATGLRVRELSIVPARVIAAHGAA